MSKKVIVIGAGGHAKVIAEIILKSNDELVGFLDDDIKMQGHNIYAGKNVIGTISDYPKYKDCYFIVGIGDNKARRKISQEINVKWYTAIHPNAIIAADVRIGDGTTIMPGVVINPGTKIGKHVIINTSTSIDHDNTIEDYVHISPGAHLAGTVFIGSNTWIGAGTTIINDISIASDNVIGAGATVIRNIADSNGIYVGVPAKKKEEHVIN